jgi:hypothetical protein
VLASAWSGAFDSMTSGEPAAGSIAKFASLEDHPQQNPSCTTLKTVGNILQWKEIQNFTVGYCVVGFHQL